jgi:hypothetical protein
MGHVWPLLGLSWKPLTNNMIMFIYSYDASRDHGIGRYINDSITGRKANCLTRKVTGSHSSQPYIGIFAADDIQVGEELRYHYGKTEKTMYWRKVYKVLPFISWHLYTSHFILVRISHVSFLY